MTWQIASAIVLCAALALGFGWYERSRPPSRVLALVAGLAALAAIGRVAFAAFPDVQRSTDIAHAVGNVVFALLLGPAFVRALARYRRRFEVRWLPSAVRAGTARVVIGAATAMLAAATRPAAAAPHDVSPAIARAVHYLRFAQNADGGFGAAPHQSSSALYTGWTALGLAAAGRNPRDLDTRSHSSIDYISRHASGITDVGDVERTLLVLRAAGIRPVLA